MANALKFLFGRIEITYRPIEPKLTKTEIIEAALQQTIYKEKYRFGFVNIRTIPYHNQSYLCGYLVAYKQSKEHEVVTKSRQIDIESVDFEIIEKSLFFIDPSLSVIAFNPKTNKLKPKLIRNLISEAINNVYNGFSVVDVDIIVDEKSYKEAISTLEVISRIIIKLRPSNPNSMQKWKPIDDWFHDNNVNNYQEEYKFSNGNPDVLNHGEIDKKISMSKAGYGITQIYGLARGKEKCISTKDNPLTKRISHINTVEMLAEEIIKKLHEVFDKIRNQK